MPPPDDRLRRHSQPLILADAVRVDRKFTRERLVIPGLQRHRDQIMLRMQYHKMVLASFGITDLSGLGKLSLSGAVIPQPGLLVPPRRLTTSILARATTFQSAFRLKKGGRPVSRRARGRTETTFSMERIGGTAHYLRAKPFPRRVTPSGRVIRHRPGTSPLFAGTSVLPIHVAYWAASEIEIGDDTVVVFQQPNRFLAIIAEKISVGSNVTFTWQRIDKPIPEPPRQPNTPDKANTPSHLGGVTGTPGTPGGRGGDSPNGDFGPEVEVWTLDMSGNPAFEVDGQDGFKGGRGGDGGDGGEGSDGRDWVPHPFIPGACESGPGSGGNGGKGGRAGDGGRGGDGGHGGRFMLYAPHATLSSFSNGFYIAADGGALGDGGDPGDPGNGGNGGSMGTDRNSTFDLLGNRRTRCPTTRTVVDGRQGGSGDEGSTGEKGEEGGHYTNAIQMYAITGEDFRVALTRPAITTLSTNEANVGDTVTASGIHFTSQDVVTVQGIDCVTNVVSDTLLSFVVPEMQGGKSKNVQVRQSDGTLSFPASLNVLPSLSYVEQNGRRSTDDPPPRFMPGTDVTLVGTGLAPDTQIWIQGNYVPGSEVTFVDSTRLRFTLIRPIDAPDSPDGEEVELRAILSDGLESNTIEIVLDTIRMVVFGDSVQWGQGLVNHLKFHTIVEEHIRASNGGVGIYKDVLAHSGALIGTNTSAQGETRPGECPSPTPTVIQQVNSYAVDPEGVDLVLLDGGINDVGVVEIVSPLATSDLVERTENGCHDRMSNLLERVMTKFRNARVIVTGYFQVVSDESDNTLLAAYLTSLGILLAGVPGALVGAAVSAAFKAIMVERSRTFFEESGRWLRQTVEEFDDTPPNAYNGPGVFFADPGFQERNSIFAPEAWLWGLNMDLSPQDDPPEGVAPARSVECDGAGYDRAEDVEICKRASAGHPNVEGAAEYAEVILALL